MSSTPVPADDASLNRLQRAYFRWAEPYYLRLDEPYRAEARRLDRFLYSRRGLWVWLGWTSAVGASALGLTHSGMPWGLALACSAVVWGGILIALASAWLMPDKFTGTRLWRGGLLAALMGFAGLLTGFVVGRVARTGSLDWDNLAERLWRILWQATPILLLAVAALFALLWGIAQIRRRATQAALAQARAQQVQDSLARQSAEARLQLLQAQIQPHFIFNTLAALQHWVDQGDPRAGPLLRELSGFLRSATEWMGQREVPLASELQVVRQYLAIMQARLGQRLQWAVDDDASLGALPVPPGLVLTLVENAIEHGISPSLPGGTVTVRVQPGEALGHPGLVGVTVCDDGLGLSPDAQDGVGLANCRSRLAHHGDGSGQLRVAPAAPGPGTIALLLLPQPAPGATP